ncbi:MAG: Type restriction enzyme res subunit, partial [Symbiobacteriaceae bacterium]|nr:Type restriction enzyme res subunit [Symbiobacteriaceae bacterium]
MSYQPQNPLIVQSDRTVLLEVMNPLFEEARDVLAQFAELVKSPEHIHTYQITPLSLWNAAASGLNSAAIIGGLERLSKFPLPETLKQDIGDYVARYGRVQLVKDEQGRLVLRSSDSLLLTEVWHNKAVRQYLMEQRPDGGLMVDPERRGHVKQAMIKIGFPVEDLAGYTTGAPLETALRAITLSGRPFDLRAYQKQSVDAFYKGGSVFGGSG